MDARLEILNDSGSLQFSSQAMNPCVAVSSSAVATSFGGSPSQRRYEISYTPRGGIRPLIAIKPGSRVMPYVYNVSTTSAYWSFLTGSAAGATMPFWIFDQPADVDLGVGLEIRADSGLLLWSLGNLPLRIVPPLITGNIPAHSGIQHPAATGVDYPMPAGRDYAVIVADPGIYWGHVYVGAGNYVLGSIGGGVQVNDNVIRVGGYLYSRESSTTTDPDYPFDMSRASCTFIPVDITHY